MRSRFGVAASAITVSTALLTNGCVDGFLAPEPNDDPVTSFDVLWTEFDRHYASFQTKQVNWTELREAYRPRVTTSTSPRELFQLLSEMLDRLRDGHVTLFTPFASYRYTGWYEGRAENFDRELAFAQLQGDVRRTSSNRIAFGHLTNRVGYVYIPGFEPGDWADEIDVALEALSGVDALVLDLRSNGGGTDLVSEKILARFMDRERVYRHFRYRNGPGHDDFTDLFADRIEPDGHHFPGPVAVLTNRRSFSATESFILGLKVLDRVMTVGDTTGGGIGNPMHRELPNGWTFGVPRWQVFNADQEHVPDGVGLAPDFPVSLLPEDVAQGRDTLILTALRLLEDAGID